MSFEDEKEFDENLPSELRWPRPEPPTRSPFPERRFGVNLGKHTKSIHKLLSRGAESWVLVRVRKKKFVTMQHLASSFDKSKPKPKRWAVLLRDFAIQEGLITKEEWQASFRGRGRPRKGKPRGPYKKRNS